MIHAHLFITQNNRDRDAHGPEFLKHMHRINEAASTNITVYHTFNDEVNLYRQHWWQCQGCGHVLKRAKNRAPGPKYADEISNISAISFHPATMIDICSDPWWGDHQRQCGGVYHKIKEPEGYQDKKKKGKVEAPTEAKTEANTGNRKRKKGNQANNTANKISKYFHKVKDSDRTEHTDTTLEHKTNHEEPVDEVSEEEIPLQLRRGSTNKTQAAVVDLTMDEHELDQE